MFSCDAFPEIDLPRVLFHRGFSTRNVWGNDACVRMTRNDGLTLWVDHADVDLRDSGGARFTLHAHDADLECVGPVFETETLSDILERI